MWYKFAISIFISILFITNYNKSFIEVDEIFLVMFLPFIDSIRVTINRIIKNKSPFVGDRNHLHHLLESFVPKIYLCFLFGIGNASLSFKFIYPERNIVNIFYFSFISY